MLGLLSTIANNLRAHPIRTAMAVSTPLALGYFGFPSSLVHISAVAAGLITALNLKLEPELNEQEPNEVDPYDDENSMRQLDERQKASLKVLQDRFREQYQAKGCDAILEEINQYLINQYQLNPVVYKNKVRPIQYNPSLAKNGKKLYYKNHFHTAYRWFLDPNPWMHKKAEHVHRNARKQGTAIFLDPEKEILCYLWLAACDPTFPFPEGYTSESMKAFLANEMSHIGRGHNWDNIRIINEETGETEEYDDMEADKPACSGGVAQRLVQTLEVMLSNFGPEYRPLNPDIIKRNFREKFIAEGNEAALLSKMDKFDLEKLKQFDEAIMGLASNMWNDSELEVTQKELMKTFTISESQANDFIQECQTRFGEDRISESGPLKWQTKDFPNYEAQIQYLAKNALDVFCDELRKFSTKKQEELQKPKDKPKGILVSFENAREEKSKAPILRPKTAPKAEIAPKNLRRSARLISAARV